MGFELIEVSHQFERLVYRVKSANGLTRQMLQDMLTTRYRRLVKAIKRLYHTVWLLCARLPPAAVQSPESFVDCVVQICNSQPASQSN